MKAIIKVHRSPTQVFLVDLRNKKLLKEIRDYLEKGKRSQAIANALSKGKFLGEVQESDIPRVNADMILTEEGTHYSIDR